jgi:hypothetical protein
MAEPLVRTASNEGGDEALISEERVREALSLLEAGQTAKGITALRTLCLAVPEVPPFVLVGRVAQEATDGRAQEAPDEA